VTGCSVLALALLAAPATPWSWQVDVGSTLLGRSSTASTSFRVARAQALGASLDRRWGDVHFLLRGEGNGWHDERDDGSQDFALAANLGLGVRIDYAAGRLRSSLAAGSSLLLVPTDVDDAPSVGAFFDIRPLAVSWPLGPDSRVGLAPLSLVVAMPVLSGIPLICLQYRTTLFLERGF
jgi:hypothetical protein